MTLQFRCAQTDQLDSFMPMVGIPSILASTLPAASEGAPCYYFATLMPSNYGHQGGGGTGSRSNSIDASGTSVLLKSMVSVLPERKVDPVHDVRLGPLLGRGSFGRVYRGE
jgi:hypothetical protein